MYQQAKCKKACIPSLEKPVNLQTNVLYAVECRTCGCHIIFRLPGPDRRLTDFIMLGEQKLLNLPWRIDGSFLEFGNKHRHLYSLPSNKDFTKGTGFSKETNMAILYEMIADGDIDQDMFNKLSVFINK